ncbi:hypothetical protein TTHERM_000823619 (macronuclear) [Tetrahymena thermophila SB210]|uniref:Uncharacterized protein n=1 Tax=Tetrahymena thermophila (strain SB210) TaxID=312017 RepID=W7X6K6_TETTS|nr:hypothetical protein TTHERM_000823619 [Tetrahymena thermophila SB210]EWS72003.1 hypothetical protein TTHERM_000823619 [Tetrahymena thermophila SB210]|eukprot:XP_012655459.1 hypothetical protein TTHERM_000823619 [Tetrahymena thermophila SB210]
MHLFIYLYIISIKESTKPNFYVLRIRKQCSESKFLCNHQKKKHKENQEKETITIFVQRKLICKYICKKRKFKQIKIHKKQQINKQIIFAQTESKFTQHITLKHSKQAQDFIYHSAIVSYKYYYLSRLKLNQNQDQLLITIQNKNNSLPY